MENHQWNKNQRLHVGEHCNKIEGDIIVRFLFFQQKKIVFQFNLVLIK